MDIIIMPGMASIVDDAAGITVRPEPFAIGGRCGAGVGSGYGAATTSYPTLGNCSGEWMERFNRCDPIPWRGKRL